MRKVRASEALPAQEQTQFRLTKAMILASTDLQQPSRTKSGASFLMDGHSVDLSEELVEQKPSIVRSKEWETTMPKMEKNQAAPGNLRVCWQCPNTSSALASGSGRAKRWLS